MVNCLSHLQSCTTLPPSTERTPTMPGTPRKGQLRVSQLPLARSLHSRFGHPVLPFFNARPYLHIPPSLSPSRSLRRTDCTPPRRGDYFQVTQRCSRPHQPALCRRRPNPSLNSRCLTRLSLHRRVSLHRIFCVYRIHSVGEWWVGSGRLLLSLAMAAHETCTTHPSARKPYLPLPFLPYSSAFSYFNSRCLDSIYAV